MAKKVGYLVIIPVNKPPYLKQFPDIARAAEIIQSRLGSMIKKDKVDGFDESMVMFSQHARKKNTLAVNDRATYFSVVGEEEYIYGTGIIIGEKDETIVGLSKAAADEIIRQINRL